MPVWILTSADRCEHPRCGAQAYVRALIGDTKLHFCAHHYAEHADALFDIGAQIIDERERLTEVAKLDVSA
jgi:hypothetical protein